MTFAQWAKNNSKINGGKDFDETFLQAIFERIAKTPLKLKESEIGPGDDSSTPKKVIVIFLRFILNLILECTIQHLLQTRTH